MMDDFKIDAYLNPIDDLEDKDTKDYDSLEEQKRERYKQDTIQRKELARWVQWLVSIWLGLIMVIIFFTGFNITNFDVTVIVTILATTTANVLGLSYIVLKGLFKANDDIA